MSPDTNQTLTDLLNATERTVRALSATPFPVYRELTGELNMLGHKESIREFMILKKVGIFLGIGLAVIGIFSANCLAVPQVVDDDIVYDVHWASFPVGSTFIRVHGIKVLTDSNGVAVHALVAGSYVRSDGQKTGFVYDHNGFINPAATFAGSDPNNPTGAIRFWNLEDLVGPLPSDYTVLWDINSFGRISGIMRQNSDGDKIPFYLDLAESQIQIHQIEVPNNAVFGSAQAYDVNELGEILVGYRTVIDGPRRAVIRSPELDTWLELPAIPEFGSIFNFNSLLDVIGTRGWPTNEEIMIHRAIDNDQDGISDGETEFYPGLTRPTNINDNGQFGASLYIAKGRDKGSYAVRIGRDGTEERRWRDSSNKLSLQVSRINLSGDAITEKADGYYNTVSYYHEGLPDNDNDQVFVSDIKSLVSPESDPDSIFAQSTSFGYYYAHLSNRDSTGWGWLAGGLDGGQLVLLIPRVPGQTPGITVTPTSGLVTTETVGGPPANFTVVLDTQPNEDVTIGISSSNSVEGTVSTASLTFTPTNWDTAQTVTVTGIDDNLAVPANPVDGDIPYTIYTAPATSADPGYDGLDADNVSVTNLDNDGPSGGSATYSTEDDEEWEPLSIPDNNTGFALSIINVPDTIEIVSLTVTLDISHSRPSDLVVELTRNGVTVELPILSGDNTVSTFNETLANGDWFLTVTDNKKKKTGTLNGWSITVDY